MSTRLNFFEHDEIWDKLNEECGVFGVYNHPDAPQLTYYGIHALQHRGQESAGICASNGEQFFYHRDMGLVTEVFSNDQLSKIRGYISIGHVRYATAGESKLENAHLNTAGAILPLLITGIWSTPSKSATN
jgi:amidophosphoribosyltransferase